MSIVRVTEPAEYDLQQIEVYISQELMNPDAAYNTVDGIVSEIYRLIKFPTKHPYVNDNTLKHLGFRMIRYRNYDIFYIYYPNEDTVHIMRILYGKSDWKTLLLP